MRHYPEVEEIKHLTYMTGLINLIMSCLVKENRIEVFLLYEPSVKLPEDSRFQIYKNRFQSSGFHCQE